MSHHTTDNDLSEEGKKENHGNKGDSVNRLKLFYALIIIWKVYITFLYLSNEYFFITDAHNQNDESLDDAYDSAYVNLQEESKKQTKTGNDDVMENPYYETDFNLASG